MSTAMIAGISAGGFLGLVVLGLAVRKCRNKDQHLKPQKLEDGDDDDEGGAELEMQNNPMARKKQNKKSDPAKSAGDLAMQQPHRSPKPARKSPKKKTGSQLALQGGDNEWIQSTDPGTGRTYWHNPTTHQSTWVDPTKSRDDGWIESVDPNSGRKYFYNTQTGKSSWSDPRKKKTKKTKARAKGEGKTKLLSKKGTMTPDEVKQWKS